jgi:hypothetical protein
MTTENNDKAPTEAVVSTPVINTPVINTPVVSRKPKKQVIQVAGNPQYASRISPNKEILNPRTNSLDWAQMPGLTTSGKFFPAGPIRLRYGEHKGPERGFGLAHIWEARKYKSATMPTPMHAVFVIETFITSILQIGSEIFYEGNLATSSDRAMVFKSTAGAVIVEERVDGFGKTWYSIITAIPRTSAKGVKIGTL